MLAKTSFVAALAGLASASPLLKRTAADWAGTPT